MSVKYQPNNNEWYDETYLPDNRRDVLIYYPESGTSIGFYSHNKWYDYKFDEYVNIKYWREIPRYESNNNL